MRSFLRLETKPRWVLVDDVAHDVSDFAHLPSGQRPNAYCPVCKEMVILKLGKVRTHHYAHRADKDCLANLPETALHLNVKFHLADQLKRCRPLVIAQPCDGRYGCTNSKLVPWLAGWNDVEVEYRIDSYRPDIALLKDGQVLGAIEVLVSHAISDEKRDYFAQHDISWVEVAANEALYKDSSRWTADAPLRFSRINPESAAWVCKECHERHEEQKAWQKEMERHRRYQELNHTDIHASKMVDVYYPTGNKFREVFYIKIKVVNGVKRRAWLEREGFKEMGSPVHANPLTKTDIQQLNTVVSAYLEEKIDKFGAQTDTVVKWQRWQPGQKPYPKDIDRYPFKFEWDATARQWRRPLPPSPSSTMVQRRADQVQRRPIAIESSLTHPPRNQMQERQFGEHQWGKEIPWGNGTFCSFCHLCGRDKIIDSQGNVIKQPGRTCPGKRF